MDQILLLRLLPARILFSHFSDVFIRPCNILLLPVLFFLCLLDVDALAQSNSVVQYGDNKSFSIPLLQAHPAVDGNLDEAVWSSAAIVNDLHQVNPIEYARPSQATEIRIFYTDSALYIGARMLDSNAGEISAQVLKQGSNISNDDYFGISLDPYLDKRNGFAFSVNPNAVRWEALFKNISEFVDEWQGIWHASTSIDENGWTAEIQIPIQTISFDPSTTVWGINFERYIARDNEWIGWVTRDRQMNPSISGTATDIQGLKQGLGLDIVPGLVYAQAKQFGTQPDLEDSLEPSLDIFYKITPQLNAALTINTDFSAAEVDDRQVNLTRFNLFFPEKRDFFLRDADIFEFGRFNSGGVGSGGNPAVPGAATQNARPFFSRQIGLSATGQPVDINYGGKLSGRVGKLNLGTLIIRQDEDITSGVDKQDIFVARAAYNVMAESTIGMIVTDGDPQSNLKNSLMGADFKYRNSRLANGMILEGNVWVQKSDTEGVSGEDTAWGFGLSSPNQSKWKGNFWFKEVEANFDPAVGFVNRTDIRDYALDAGYRHRFAAGGFLRSIYGGVDAYRVELLENGDVSSESIGLRLTGDNNSGDGMFSRIITSREVLLEDFTIYCSADGRQGPNCSPNASQSVIIPQGDYTYNEALIGIDSGRQRKIALRAVLKGGEYYDGTHMRQNYQLRWRPIRYLSFVTSYTEDAIKLPGGNFTVRLLSLNASVAFSSRLSWTNLVQYDNVSENLGFNSRLHWIPEAGREAYIVFNYGMQDINKDNNFESTTADLSIKFNYTFRF